MALNDQNNENNALSPPLRPGSLDYRQQNQNFFPTDAFEFTDPNSIKNDKANILIRTKSGWKIAADAIELQSDVRSLNDLIQDIDLSIESNRNDIREINGNTQIISQTVFDNGVETSASLTLVSNDIGVINGTLTSIGAEAAVEAGITIPNLDSKINSIAGTVPDLGADDNISVTEQNTVDAELISVDSEYNSLTSLATTYGIDTETAYVNYDNAYDALQLYIYTTLDWNNAKGSDIAVTGSVWFQKWDDYYDTRTILDAEIGLATFAQIDQAQQDATEALGKLTDIDADGLVTPSEKLIARKEWEAIKDEYPDIETKADYFYSKPGADTTIYDNYVAYYDALNTYLNTTLTSGIAPDPITAGVFSNMSLNTSLTNARQSTSPSQGWDLYWQNYYSYRGIILSDIARLAGVEADSAVARIAVMDDDGVITAKEKANVFKDWDKIQQEYPQVIAQYDDIRAEFVTQGISTTVLDGHKTNYENSYNTLETYLYDPVTGLLYGANKNSDSNVTRGTWDTNWLNYFTDLKDIQTYMNEYGSAFALQADARSKANDALSTANEVILNNIADDNIITKQEKAQAIEVYNTVVAEHSAIMSGYSDSSISTAAYDLAYNNLVDYLLNDLTGFTDTTVDTTIVKATWDNEWSLYWTALNDLVSKVGNDSSSILSSMASDGVITKQEKPLLFQETDRIAREKLRIDQAILDQDEDNGYEFQDYLDAYSNLFNYLNNVGTPSLVNFFSLAHDTSVTKSEWDGYWNAYYDAYADIGVGVANGAYAYAGGTVRWFSTGEGTGTGVQALEDATTAAQGTANDAATAASNAQGTANTADGKANNLINSTTLTPAEKLDAFNSWQSVLGEYEAILDYANASSAVTAAMKTNYTNARNSLFGILFTTPGYLNDLTTSDTFTNRVTQWDDYWNNYHSTREVILTTGGGGSSAGALLAVSKLSARVVDNAGNPINEASVKAVATTGGSFVAIAADQIILGDDPTTPTLDGALTISGSDVIFGDYANGAGILYDAGNPPTTPPAFKIRGEFLVEDPTTTYNNIRIYDGSIEFEENDGTYTNPIIFSDGASIKLKTTDVVLEYNGAYILPEDSATRLGDTAHKWLAIHSDFIRSHGNAEVDGNLTVSGSLTLNQNIQPTENPLSLTTPTISAGGTFQFSRGVYTIDTQTITAGPAYSIVLEQAINGAWRAVSDGLNFATNTGDGRLRLRNTQSVSLQFSYLKW